jgi:hypothetical protein
MTRLHVWGSVMAAKAINTRQHMRSRVSQALRLALPHCVLATARGRTILYRRQRNLQLLVAVRHPHVDAAGDGLHAPREERRPPCFVQGLVGQRRLAVGGRRRAQPEVHREDGAGAGGARGQPVSLGRRDDALAQSVTVSMRAIVPDPPRNELSVPALKNVLVVVRLGKSQSGQDFGRRTDASDTTVHARGSACLQRCDGGQCGSDVDTLAVVCGVAPHVRGRSNHTRGNQGNSERGTMTR